VASFFSRKGWEKKGNRNEKSSEVKGKTICSQLSAAAKRKDKKAKRWHPFGF
jgi:hypothetical protein